LADDCGQEIVIRCVRPGRRERRLIDAVVSVKVLEHVRVIEEGNDRPRTRVRSSRHEETRRLTRGHGDTASFCWGREDGKLMARSRNDLRTFVELKNSEASSRAAEAWRSALRSTVSMAPAASSGVENASNPSPVGSQSEKPVSWTIAGRPLAR